MVGMFQSRSCVRDSVVRIMRCYGGLSVNIFSKSIHMRRHGETCVPQDTVPAKGQTPPGSRDGQVEVGPRATGPVAIMHKVLGETLAVRTVCERAAVGNRTGRQAERFRGRKERRRARRRVGLKENSKWSLATGCRMRPRWAWEGVGEGASARESEGQISAHSPSPPQRPTPDRAANIKMLARWPAIGRERLRAMIAARASPALPSSL